LLDRSSGSPPQFYTVEASAWECKGQEHAVEVVQATTADQRQGAAKPPAERAQQSRQSHLQMHLFRVLGDLDQGAAKSRKSAS